MNRWHVRTFVLSLLLFLPAASLAAQETTGGIRGRVADQQSLAVPGATVVATGPQGAQEATTGTDGRFTIPFLTPGAYTVRAQLDGFKTAERQGVAVSLGQVVDLPLVLEIGGVTETITVAATAAPIDVTNATIGAVIDSDFVESVPVGRRISDISYLAPGVSSGGSVGRQNPSIGGSSGLDNQYVIDGVNITNSGYGALGSYSIYHGSLGNATPFDFIKEVQVKTGGYEAEFGQSVGGVVNVVTKSGSNSLRGSAFGYARPSAVEGGWKQFQSENGTVQTLSSQTRDAGTEGGGALIKNRLFFFVAADGQWETQTLQAPDGFPLFKSGGYDRERRNFSYAGKMTFQLASSHRLDASVFGDPSDGPMGPQRPSSLMGATTTAFSEIHYGGHSQTLRYSGAIGGHWLIEGAYARSLNRLSELPASNVWQVKDQTVSPQAVSGGIGFYEAGNRSLDQQVTFKGTNITGGHQIKYGLEYDHADYRNLNQVTGPHITAPDGRTTATGAGVLIVSDPVYGRIYRVNRAYFTSGIDTPQHFVSLFVQDSWSVGSHLTLNPGLRYEQENLSGTVIKDFTLKNNWAPRLGVAYDLHGDGKTKIFGNWGRFFSRLPNDVAVKALSGIDRILFADYFDAGLTQPVPNGTAAGGKTIHYSVQGASASSTIDPNTKLGYEDEFIVGVEREVLAGTSLTLRYVHRNVGRIVEDLGDVPMAAFDLGVDGIPSDVTTVVTNPSSSSPVNPAAAFLGASFDDPVHKYNAVELVLNRRLKDHWAAMASYRWSRLRGNYEGYYESNRGQADPGWTSLYDFPSNDPSYSGVGASKFGYEGDIRFLGQVGLLPLDRTHQIKAFANYVWDCGLNIGAALNMQSGTPLTPLAASSWYGQGGEIPAAPRGSGIETIDGFRTRTPFESQLDLQASFDFKLGGARRLTLLADVFNVLNERRVLNYDTWTQLDSLDANPDFGKPVSQVPTAYGPQIQAPIQARVGARFSF